MIKYVAGICRHYLKGHTRVFIMILSISTLLITSAGCSSLNDSNEIIGNNTTTNQSKESDTQGIIDQQNDNNSSIIKETKNNQEVILDSSSKDIEGIKEGSSSENTNDGILIDYTTIQPNEAGDIPIVMFHKFTDKYPEGNKDEYLITLEDFEGLLNELYVKKFRLVSMQDFINNEIELSAGYSPVVFTFDDGVSSQFSLVSHEGELQVNPETAVAIMLEFNKKHPDFGLEGTFYIEMGKGESTFAGDGSLNERFDKLINLGFEIGNHTWSHLSLATKNISEAIIKEQLGRNQLEFSKIYDGYKMSSLALPYGEISKNEGIMAQLFEGEYNGVKYENRAVMAVGWCPSVVPWNKKYNSGYVNRVRATSMIPADYDISWWLNNKDFMSRRFVSDGNKSTVVVPEDVMEMVDLERLGDKRLITYKRQ